PYMVEKSKLIERIADLLLEKRLPLLGDIADESADDIRIVLDPKSKNIEPQVLMESLFKSSDLEVRFAMNLNVLDEQNVPRVMSVKDILSSFLNHRQVVLKRRSQHRRQQIIDRLELLDGYLIAYLNIDEVIRIIRDEDEPKPIMMEKFALTDTQAEAILNMRLRSLRKLQEMEIRTEHKALSEELDTINKLLADEKLQWKNIKADLKAIEKIYGLDTPHGKRRTTFELAPDIEIKAFEESIEQEDLTLVLSSKYWIRTLKGHNPTDIRYKEGDEERFVFNTKSTDKLLIVAASGKCFTLDMHKLPKVRGGQTSGAGEPLRMMIDLEPQDEIINCFVVDPRPSAGADNGSDHKAHEVKILLASNTNRGFIVCARDAFSSTKNGKQVFTTNEGEKVIFAQAVDGDHLAVLAENRKMLIFPLSEMPEQSRG
ncbi:MAG: DNA gyrase subunit A, partial [Alphaproteobacteria bacterium]|nr:DNA gyrase subunit A [Alphaproteobacteria bacterium]